MPVVALIEIRAGNVLQVKALLEPEPYVAAFYELVGQFNIGIVVEVKDKQTLFDVVTQIRAIPSVEETKTHVIQDGVVI